MTPEQFKTIAPRAKPDFMTAFLEQMPAWDIETLLREAHFMAQMCVETAGFTAFVENLNYSAILLARTWPSKFAQNPSAPAAERIPNDLAPQYEHQPEKLANFVYGGRGGNTQPYDGWTYRGRPAMTFRDNYKACGLALGIPLEEQPELLERPDINAEAHCWFWYSHGCNAYADNDDVVRVSATVNTKSPDTPEQYIVGMPLRRSELGRIKLILGA